VIVVGVDRSPAAAAALRWAVEESRSRGTTVKAILAWQRPLPFGWRTIPPELLATSALEGTARRMLEAAVDEALAGHDGDVECEVIEGPAAETLAAASRGAELLVVGSPRHHPLGGSTAAACLAHAYCPVVVVHDDSTERRGRAALIGFLLRHGAERGPVGASAQ
jgi:nucleotide-binding universal stress UspA family protein